MSAPNEGRQSPPPQDQSDAQAGKTAGGKVSQVPAWLLLLQYTTPEPKLSLRADRGCFLNTNDPSLIATITDTLCSLTTVKTRTRAKGTNSKA